MSNPADEQHSPEQIAELLAILSHEDAVFRALTRNVEQLYEIHAAKDILAGLLPEEIRRGLNYRQTQTTES